MKLSTLQILLQFCRVSGDSAVSVRTTRAPDFCATIPGRAVPQPI